MIMKIENLFEFPSIKLSEKEAKVGQRFMLSEVPWD